MVMRENDEIDFILKRVLQGADCCSRCKKGQLIDSFLCMECGEWHCNGCEENEKMTCKTCALRKQIKLLT